MTNLIFLFILSHIKLSWFEQALAGCPDFSFTNYPFEPVNLEPLKNTFPNEEAKIWCVPHLMCVVSIQKAYNHDVVIVMFLPAVQLHVCIKANIHKATFVAGNTATSSSCTEYRMLYSTNRLEMDRWPIFKWLVECTI